MNEADTPNNGDFIEPVNLGNSLPSQSASCPFYSVLPQENRAIAKLPPAKPTPEEQLLLVASDSEISEITESEELEEKISDRILASDNESHEEAPKQDWVAEPDSAKQALIDAEFQKLLALNEELRSDNDKLYNQVEELKDALTESEKAFQWQKKRSSVTESMLNQQTQELTAAQEQINSLFQQLETALPTVQRQELLIETYKTQLEISQQRIAQLERECALLQTNYNEQSHHLSQSENTCRELRTRLMRQQRQTLQFKAALEKCLESPVPGSDILKDDDSANSFNDRDIASSPRRYSKRANSVHTSAQPIKPWSGESLSVNVDNIQGGFSASSPSQQNNPAPTTLSPSSPWDWAAKEDTPKPTQPAPSPEPEIISSLGSSNIDEQLDSVIQMFFASQTASPSPQSSIQNNIQNNDVEANCEQPVTSTWEAFATHVEDNQEPVTPLTTGPGEENTFFDPEPLPESSMSSFTDTTVEENEDYWSEVVSQVPSNWEFSATELPQEPFGSYSDVNSPSPVIYPKRPPKGRKSLASVELPNFRPNGQ
jgi:hypothetical protein